MRLDGVEDSVGRISKRDVVRKGSRGGTGLSERSSGERPSLRRERRRSAVTIDGIGEIGREEDSKGVCTRKI